MIKIEVLWQTLISMPNWLFMETLELLFYKTWGRKDICMYCKLVLNLWKIGTLIWMHYLILKYSADVASAFPWVVTLRNNEKPKRVGTET